MGQVTGVLRVLQGNAIPGSLGCPCVMLTQHPSMSAATGGVRDAGREVLCLIPVLPWIPLWAALTSVFQISLGIWEHR